MIEHACFGLVHGLFLKAIEIEVPELVAMLAPKIQAAMEIYQQETELVGCLGKPGHGKSTVVGALSENEALIIKVCGGAMQSWVG